MQSTFDGLLIALLMALAPSDQDLPPDSDPSFRDGFNLGYQELKLHEPPAQGDAAGCRFFIDEAARKNCMVRTGRAQSGSAENLAQFPDDTIWIVPRDPAMPLRFQPKTPR